MQNFVATLSKIHEALQFFTSMAQHEATVHENPHFPKLNSQKSMLAQSIFLVGEWQVIPKL